MFDATTLFTLAGKLVLDSNEFNSSVNQAKGTFSGLGMSMDSAISKVKRGLAALVGGVTIGKLLSLGISFNSQIDSYNKNFGVLLQDSQKGIELTQQLKEKAMATPFNVTDLAGATQSLLAYGIAGEDVLGILDTLGDIALGDKAKLQSIATVFGQISMAGKLLTQDYKQLLGQGFNPLTYISKRTGESMEELQDRLSKGKITVEEVTQAFKDATDKGGQFYQGASVGATTFDGRLSTLKGTWEEFIGQFTAPITQNLADKIFPALTDSINAISAALFGAEEQSQKTKAELFGVDENGNEVDPYANIQDWYSRVLESWHDGKPELGEGYNITQDYIEEFNATTDRLKQAIHDRLTDTSEPLTPEEQAKYEENLGKIKALQDEQAAILQGGTNMDDLSDTDKNRLWEIAQEIGKIQQELFGSDIPKEQSPMERLISTLADKGVDAIGAVTDWIVNFINNWPTYQETLKGYIDTVLAWFASIGDAISSISNTWNAFGLDIGDVLKLFLGAKGLIMVLQLAGTASKGLSSNLSAAVVSAGTLFGLFMEYKAATEKAAETPTVKNELEKVESKTGLDRVLAEADLHGTMTEAAKSEFSNAFWTKVFGIFGKEAPGWLMNDTNATTSDYIQEREQARNEWRRFLGLREVSIPGNVDYTQFSGTSRSASLEGILGAGTVDVSEVGESKIAAAAQAGIENATVDVTVNIDGMALRRSQNQLGRRFNYAYGGGSGSRPSAMRE